MKSYKNQNQLLDDSIAAIKLKRQQDVESFKAQYHIVLESLRPSNIVNQSILDISSSYTLKGNLKSSFISILGGYLSKKLVVRKSKSFFKNMLGYILQAGVTSFIASKVEPELSD